MNTRRLFFLMVIFLFSAAVFIMACGDDDDDSGSGPGQAQEDDDAEDDDDATDDDDAADDDNDDNDSADDDDEIAGPPWYECPEQYDPAGAEKVVAFDAEYHYVADGDNRQTIDKQVDFPEAADWAQVTMMIQLGRPEDGQYDSWDRLGNLFLVQNPGTDDEEVLEIWRYITPYRRSLCMLADVTEFGPLLAGPQTLRSYVSTWVGPDSGFADGNGWTVTATFFFHPASKQGIPDRIINIWPYASIEVGNPDNPISGQIGDQAITLPDTISKAELRSLVTGHGQGNKNNCAEFCNLDQVVLVNDEPFSFDPWRDDCDENPNGPGQQGTWEYNRAGWCPGAPVVPQVFDITDQLVPGQTNNFVYQVWEEDDLLYENTCRPGAGDGDNYCEDCAFDSNPGNCDYNGGMHTMPTDYVAVQIFIWE